MTEEISKDRMGMSFLFEPLNGKGVTASGHSLKACYDAHPDLRSRVLCSVWCHCCNNQIWSTISVHGNPSEPWDEKYCNGDDSYAVEYHEWDESIFD